MYTKYLGNTLYTIHSFTTNFPLPPGVAALQMMDIRRDLFYICSIFAPPVLTRSRWGEGRGGPDEVESVEGWVGSDVGIVRVGEELLVIGELMGKNLRVGKRLMSIG